MTEKEAFEKRVPVTGDSSPIEPPVDLDDDVEFLPGVYHLPYIRQLLKDPYSQEGVIVEIPDVTRSESLVKAVARPQERLRYSQDPADVEGPEDLSTNRPANIARRSERINPYTEEDRFDDRNSEDFFDGVVGHAHRGGRLEQEAQRRSRAVFDQQAWKDLKSNE